MDNVLQNPPPPPVDHKIYLIVSVALATISFFVNAIQIVALVHKNQLTTVRNILQLSQSIGGLVTTFTVIYPIKLVTSEHPSHWHDPYKPNFLSDFATCLTIGSGIYLMAIFLAITNSTLTILEQYLSVAHPRRHLHYREEHMSLTVFIAIGWIETTILTLMPWLGWNDWTGRCLMPDLWTRGFGVLLSVTVCVHLTAESIMVAKMWLVLRRKVYAINPESEEMPVAAASSLRASYDGRTINTTDLQHQNPKTSAVVSCTAAFLVTFACHLPLFVHWLSYAGCGGDEVDCPLIDSERTNAFIWTSILLLINSVVKPLLNVFDDDQSAKPSLDILRLCLCPLPL